jgi:cell division transport system permease protein
LFERKIAFDALAGSLIGGTVAALVLALLAASASFAGELTGGASLSPADLVLLALVPVALTVLSTWVARTAVLAALRQTL